MNNDLPDFRHSFLQVIDGAFEKFAERPCVLFNDESLTYGELDRASAAVANALLANGFEPGMKAAVYSLNSARSVIATLGIIRAGGVWIPVNPRNSPADNITIMVDFDCQALFYQAQFADAIDEVTRRIEQQIIVVNLDPASAGEHSFTDWIADQAGTAPRIDRDPDDLVSIPLTGGTTGLPKGVMLSHSNFCAIDYAMRVGLDTDDTVFLCAAPMTHVGGRIFLASLSSGGRFVILEKVDMQIIMETIQSEGITDMFLPPTAIYTWLEQPNVSDFDYSSLRRVSYGSSPISLERLRQAIRTFGCVMQGGYSQTECPMFISMFPPAEHMVDGEIVPDSRLASVGRATPISEVGILDELGNELPVGEIGEISVKGPGVSLGYYRAPEQTDKIRLNGWHLTGDIGYLDDEGYVFIVDRKKDMIITGGFNVYSAEVERGLMSMEGIGVAIVFGVPSEKWGEEVKALVQLEPGADLSAEQIIGEAKKRLGGVKAPKSVEIVDDFVRTPVGKIDKKAIRAPYWQGRGKRI